MKMKFILSIMVLGSMAASLSASAALFDTIDSVETLQKIAAQNKEKHPDRMPAGKEDKATNGDAQNSKNTNIQDSVKSDNVDQ